MIEFVYIINKKEKSGTHNPKVDGSSPSPATKLQSLER